MLRWLLPVFGIFAFPLLADASVSKEDVRKLIENRISDELIIAFIRANGPVTELSSSDLVELKKLGASDPVVLALIKTAPATPARVQQQPRQYRERQEKRPPSYNTVCVDGVSDPCTSSVPVYQSCREIRIRTPRVRSNRSGRFSWRGRCR